MNKAILLVCMICVGSFSVNGQVYNYEDGEGPVDPDSIQGLYIGLNIGYYFANSNTATIYGGFGYTRDGFLNSDFSDAWLNLAIQGGQQQLDRTERALGGVPEDFWLFTITDMPGEMRFSGSFLYGIHFRYMFNSDFGALFELNGTNPVTVGEFTIQRLDVASSNPGQNQPLERFQIRGEEQRLMANLGIHKVFGREASEKNGKSSSLLPYFDLGGTVTFTRFDRNFINMRSEGIVDLTQFFDNIGNFQAEANVLTGIGFGGFGGIGAQLSLGSKFTINIGYIANLQQIKLGEFGDIGLQHQFILRAIYM